MAAAAAVAVGRSHKEEEEEEEEEKEIAALGFGCEYGERRDEKRRRTVLLLYLSFLFLPAAKPSGPRTVRVVGVGGGRDRDPTPKKIYIADIEMVLKFNFVFFCSRPSLHVASLFISHP